MWIIDEDLSDTGNHPPGTNENAKGICSRDWDESKADKATLKFRMLDGDENVYYVGRMTDRDDFRPLDEFGAPNAGCTGMQVWSRWTTGGYELKEERWVEL